MHAHMHAHTHARTHTCTHTFLKPHAYTSEGYMTVIDSGEFNAGKMVGLLDVSDSSYYCIVNSATVAEDVPEIRYRIITMKQKIPVMNQWNCDVCILPAISTCKMVNWKQICYNKLINIYLSLSICHRVYRSCVIVYKVLGITYVHCTLVLNYDSFCNVIKALLC